MQLSISRLLLVMNADIAAASSDDLSRLHSPLSTPLGWDVGEFGRDRCFASTCHMGQQRAPGGFKPSNLPEIDSIIHHWQPRRELLSGLTLVSGSGFGSRPLVIL